jgi:8-hydroxy-5-deazaflavin:NADPH oxidoreductase
MNIGIIGAGGMGSCLASKFVQLGHLVSIANSRGPASLRELEANCGASASTVEEVTKGKDLIIVSIPEKSVLDLPKNLFNQLPKEAVVIDTGNYYPGIRDGVIPSLEESGIDSLWVQEQLGFPIVKAFNAIFSESLRDGGRPKGARDRIAVAVAGDDPKAKELVFGLIEALGFDPFDLGDIRQSWKQQPVSSIYCRDIPLDELKRRADAMGTDWSAMRDLIIGRRRAAEPIMVSDYPAYLQSLKD